MPLEKRTKLRNLIQIDEAQLDKILEQIPSSFSVLESIRAPLGILIKFAKFEIQANSSKTRTAIQKIRCLESYLERNRLINKTRPRRMPHAILNGSQYWWVRESLFARKVVVPTPVLLEKFGIAALTVWISNPKKAPKPKDEWDWTGSFLYLPTIHYDSGRSASCISGCSALQFIVNAASDLPLFAKNPREPFGRNSNKHPIEKLGELEAFVSEERRIESLYYVRYITNE